MAQKVFTGKIFTSLFGSALAARLYVKTDLNNDIKMQETNRAFDPREASSSLLRHVKLSQFIVEVQLTSPASFDGRVVTLVVGIDQREFHVQLSHLQRTSSFFQSAFKQVWAEGQKSRISLPDEDPDIVNNYLHFAYTGKIPSKDVRTGTDPEEEFHMREYVKLAQLYCFGEKYQDSNFKNTIINAIIGKSQTPNAEGHQWYPSGNAVDIIYCGTCEGSLARKLMVDMHIGSGYGGWLVGNDHNKDFLEELSRESLDALYADRQGEFITRDNYDNCTYHTHDSSQFCAMAESRKRKHDEVDAVSDT